MMPQAGSTANAEPERAAKQHIRQPGMSGMRAIWTSAAEPPIRR
jgi:hypothetical protein